MCGIVGLFIKNPRLENQLGALLSPMLVEMTDRGPDSAGIAVYRNRLEIGGCKMTLLAEHDYYDWSALETALSEVFGEVSLKALINHAVVRLPESVQLVSEWLNTHRPELHINSAGRSIEIFKEKGLPASVVARYRVDAMRGSHALGHTRMATESAVTSEHSHPFSTGEDVCLVHNGSLSNHNTLRRELRRNGIEFSTDNDSEVAAGYLAWRLREGDDLDAALNNAIGSLDGFYTFAIGTKDGFAVLRDPIGCKPAVLAETDDWVAMSSEFRAIATLPGADSAYIWEPEPAKIYSWQRAA